MCIQFGETLIKYIRMMDKQYKETAEYLAKRVTGNPETAIILDSMAFSFYDEKKHDFCVEPGIFEICVGNSTQNILLHQKIEYPNCSKQNV